MKKLSKPTKIILICVLVCVLVFAAVLIVWRIRYNILFKPYLENENFSLTYSDDETDIYSYDTDYAYTEVSLPFFLHFNGSIHSKTNDNIGTDENGNIDVDSLLDFSCSFLYFPKLFGDSYITWTIYDYEAYSDDLNNVIGPTIITDTELNLIEYYPDEGLSELTYEDCYEDMKEYYNTYIVAVCNNDTFKKIE